MLYIILYTLDDGLTGLFYRYTLEAIRTFIETNKLASWELYSSETRPITPQANDLPQNAVYLGKGP